jgi:CHASE1-domain containing sensor protein
LSIGAELDALPWVGVALLGAGLLLALGAAGLIYASLPKSRAP